MRRTCLWTSTGGEIGARGWGLRPRFTAFTHSFCQGHTTGVALAPLTVGPLVVHLGSDDCLAVCLSRLLCGWASCLVLFRVQCLVTASCLLFRIRVARKVGLILPRRGNSKLQLVRAPRLVLPHNSHNFACVSVCMVVKRITRALARCQNCKATANFDGCLHHHTVQYCPVLYTSVLYTSVL